MIQDNTRHVDLRLLCPGLTYPLVNGTFTLGNCKNASESSGIDRMTYALGLIHNYVLLQPSH